jgi:hypothetical protein
MGFGEVLRGLPGAQIPVSPTKSSDFQSPSFDFGRSTLSIRTLVYSLLSLIREIRVIRGLFRRINNETPK